jgi:manganese/zinc/iron transport system ATP- binding protein
VIAVHHDLSTVAEYFDRVFLMNVRASPKAPVAEAFTAEALATAYGGRLAATHVDELALAGSRV